jgi:hypothetical protein
MYEIVRDEQGNIGVIIDLTDELRPIVKFNNITQSRFMDELTVLSAEELRHAATIAIHLL